MKEKYRISTNGIKFRIEQEYKFKTFFTRKEIIKWCAVNEKGWIVYYDDNGDSFGYTIKEYDTFNEAKKALDKFNKIHPWIPVGLTQYK